MGSSNITVRLLPSLFSLPGLVYWYNDCCNQDIRFNKTSVDGNITLTAIAYRNIFPFFPKKYHSYTLEDPHISESEFKNLVSYEIRHPFMRSFIRPLFYAGKIPYPVL